MKNFPVIINGEEYWIHRATATVTLVFCVIENKWYILANKRGAGLPTNVGKWNCPSGFLDFDERIVECAAREVFEETGLDIHHSTLTLVDIDDNPERDKQNILYRYMTTISFSSLEEANRILTAEHSEPNEVDEIKWIPIDEVSNYEWTSEKHKEMITNIYRKYYL